MELERCEVTEASLDPILDVRPLYDIPVYDTVDVVTIPSAMVRRLHRALTEYDAATAEILAYMRATAQGSDDLRRRFDFDF